MNLTRLTANYFRRPFTEQLLHVEAAFWLGTARLAILILPFRWIAPFLGTHMAVSDAHHVAADREKAISVSRAVLTMSRHLPWECRCLVQSIAGKMMLRRRRIRSTLYLGVAKKEDGDLNAHAWLRTGDTIILGGGDWERFAVVSTFS